MKHITQQNTLKNTVSNNNNKSLLIRNMATEAAEPRKAGVASPSELKEFVSSAGSNLLVVDVRHPDASVEPGDAKSLAVAGFPDSTTNYRPNAVNLPWSRETNSMELPSENVAKDTPIITHCGGGGRGQKAKDYLESKGYTNVLNGGGPKETDCWAEYGDK
jgi:rhodanese-related sulfurtransferase